MHLFNNENAIYIDICVFILISCLAFVGYQYFFDRRVLFMMLLGISFILEFFKPKNNVVKVHRFDIIVFIFSFYVLLHHLILVSDNTLLNYILWVYVGYWGTQFLFRKSFLRFKKSKLIDCQKYVYLIIACSSVIVSFFQYFNGQNNNSVNTRVASIFLSANFYGIYISCALLILFQLMTSTKYLPKKLKVIHLIVLFLLILGMYFSKSRGAFVALLAGGAFLIFKQKNRLQVWNEWSKNKKWFISVILSFVGVAMLAILYCYNKDSVSGRWTILKIGSKTILEQPFFGYGMNSFSSVYNKAKSEYFWEKLRPFEQMKVADYVATAFNDYLEIIIELGFWGFFLCLLLLLILVLDKQTDSNVVLAQGLLVAIAIFGLTNSATKSIPLMVIGSWASAIILCESKSKRILFKSKYLKTGIAFSILILGVLFLSTEYIRKFNGHKFAQESKNANPENAKDYIASIKNTYGLLNDGFASTAFGQKLFTIGEIEKSITFLETGFNKNCHPEAGKFLAQSYIENGNYYKAYKLLKFNIGNEPYKYTPRAKLANFLKHSSQLDELSYLYDQIASLGVKIPSDSVTKYKKEAAEFLQKYNSNKTSGFRLSGSLSEPRKLFSNYLNTNLSYQIYLPAIKEIKKRLPILYVLDGDRYIENTDIMHVLERLIEEKKIPPTVVVFLESKYNAINNDLFRENIFNCNSSFYSFFIQELIPFIEKKYPVIQKHYARNILGVSFGGLAASYLEISSKKAIFNRLALQSPAFHICPNIYNAFQAISGKKIKLYLSYGTGNDTEKQVLPLLDILNTNSNFDAKIRKINGGDHQWDIWNNQIEEILRLTLSN